MWKFIGTVVIPLIASQSLTHAQAANNPQTWFSINGSDTASCGAIETPCLTLNYAYGQTRAGGTIQCSEAHRLYFPPVIAKSITIICDQSRSNNATSGGWNLASINAAPNDLVTFIGLALSGSRSNIGSVAPGIDFNGSGTLVLDRVSVGSWITSGVLFRPFGVGKLVINDSTFVDNGNGSVGAGIRVVPQGSGTAQVSINNSRVSGNVFGIAVDGSASTGGINTTIRDSVMSSNTQDGIVATSSPSTAPVGVNVVNSASINNAYGIRSIGSNVTVRAEGTKIFGNGIGLSGGGALLTGGGNTIQANATNGSFTGSYSQQ